MTLYIGTRGLYVCLCVRPSVHKKSFSDFDLIWCVGRPRLDMRTSMTSTRPRSRSRSLSFWSSKNCTFFRSISCAILAWSSNLMVNYDNMGPSLQLVRAWFFNFLLRKLSCDFVECRRYRTFKEPYFSIAWGSSHVVGYAGSPVCILHADMTLTRSKVKVTWVWPSAPFWGLLFSSSHDLTQEVH